MQYSFQPVAGDPRQEAARPFVGGFDFDVLAEVWAVLDKPLHAALEAGQLFDQLRIEGLDGEERNQPDHGTNSKRLALAVGQTEHIVKKAVLAVPEFDVLAAEIVHRVADIDKV